MNDVCVPCLHTMSSGYKTGRRGGLFSTKNKNLKHLSSKLKPHISSHMICFISVSALHIMLSLIPRNCDFSVFSGDSHASPPDPPCADVHVTVLTETPTITVITTSLRFRPPN